MSVFRGDGAAATREAEASRVAGSVPPRSPPSTEADAEAAAVASAYTTLAIARRPTSSEPPCRPKLVPQRLGAVLGSVTADFPSMIAQEAAESYQAPIHDAASSAVPLCSPGRWKRRIGDAVAAAAARLYCSCPAGT